MGWSDDRRLDASSIIPKPVIQLLSKTEISAETNKYAKLINVLKQSITSIGSNSLPHIMHPERYLHISVLALLVLWIGRSKAGLNSNAEVLYLLNEPPSPEGYRYKYVLSNNIVAEQRGKIEHPNTDDAQITVDGSYSIIFDKNDHLLVEYIADKNGNRVVFTYGKISLQVPMKLLQNLSG